MRLRRIATTLMLVLLTACGEPGATSPRAFSAAALGACSRTGEMDGPDPATYVSTPGAWVRVDAIEAADAGTKTTDIRGTYVVVGGDAALTEPLGMTPESLKMHGSFARSTAEALALGATVHMHTGIVGDPRHVAFSLAVKDGDFAFLGNCQYRALTEPIAALLGADAAPRLTALIGKTSPEMRAVLVPDTPRPTGEPILNPEDVAPEVLAKLRTGFFALSELPDSWQGPNTICTRIAAGWADCVDLGTRSTATIRVNYYFDPTEPAVEIWLLDADGSVTRPVAKLATVDLTTLAERDRIDLGKPGVNLTLTLSASPSREEVVTDPEKARHAVARVALSYD